LAGAGLWICWRGSSSPASADFSFLNGYFSDGRRSPQVFDLDVRMYASAQNLCAALPIEKITIQKRKMQIFMDI
jgi:hypothetical protein